MDATKERRWRRNGNFGIHTSERSDLPETLVRGEWGYDGLIMTDWVITAMGSKGKYRHAKVVPTIKAGNNLFIPVGPADYKFLVKRSTFLKGQNGLQYTVSL